jgi:hypothetical protein
MPMPSSLIAAKFGLRLVLFVPIKLIDLGLVRLASSRIRDAEPVLVGKFRILLP